MKLLFSLLSLFFVSGFIQDSTITIKIDELRSQEGNIHVAIFLDQDSFKSEVPHVKKIFSKKDFIQGEAFVCNISLPNGKYGISILDDENGDGDMNYNFVGIPKEGYGFSNFVHTGFSRPTFSDFDFSLEGDIEEMNIELRYF